MLVTNIFFSYVTIFSTLSKTEIISLTTFVLLSASACIPFPNKPWFLRVCCTSLLKTLGKGEIARNEQFLHFPQCFLFSTHLESFLPFLSNLKWSCANSFSLKSLKFVFWERVNMGQSKFLSFGENTSCCFIPSKTSHN